jgi:hypothetical protein
MSGLVISFIAKHYVCDYLLQSPYQLENKRRYAHPGAVLHAGLHGAATALICVGHNIPAVWGLADAAIHLHIDWLKALFEGFFSLSTRDAGYWRLYGLDQAFHYLTYAWIAAQ